MNDINAIVWIISGSSITSPRGSNICKPLERDSNIKYVAGIILLEENKTTLFNTQRRLWCLERAEELVWWPQGAQRQPSCFSHPVHSPSRLPFSLSGSLSNRLTSSFPLVAYNGSFEDLMRLLLPCSCSKQTNKNSRWSTTNPEKN